MIANKLAMVIGTVDTPDFVKSKAIKPPNKRIVAFGGKLLEQICRKFLPRNKKDRSPIL